VKPLDFPLFADENITPDVARGLVERGHDVRGVRDDGLVGRPDVEVLETATRQGRVVVTHDLAFGRSAIRAGASFVGIVYIRPGHISAAFVLDIVDALGASTLDVQSPFIAVAERQQNTVRVRVRIRPPW
jgi:predicted nuclease of predicted toxin-antitoxin system